MRPSILSLLQVGLLLRASQPYTVSTRQRQSRSLPVVLLRAVSDGSTPVTNRRELLSGLAVGLAPIVATADDTTVVSEVAAAAAAAADSNAPFTVQLDLQLKREGGELGQKGTLLVEVLPEWAPLAAARFRELVESGYYTDCRFHRVLPGYVAQFGIAADPKVAMTWLCRTCKRLPDEPLRVSNKRGTLSFASGGKDTRQAQVFINLANNGGIPNFLDQNFTPFARVVGGSLDGGSRGSGDDVISGIYSGYGLLESASGGLAGSVSQSKAAAYGTAYLDDAFPKLSYIRKATIVGGVERPSTGG